MDRHTDAAVPWIDGAIAMLSITAQWLLARRRVESWLLWIIVDLIAVPLFASRGLYATSAVYVVLLGLSIDGLIQWRRAAAPVRAALCRATSASKAPKTPASRRPPRASPRGPEVPSSPTRPEERRLGEWGV